MSPIPTWFAALALIAAALALIAVWSPRRLGVKLGALLTALLLLPVAYASFADLLSRPKPVKLEWMRAQEATVLASSVEEGTGIYVWLMTDEAAEPRAYVLPWDQKLAEELQEAERRADGNGVVMRSPFEPSLDDREPRFYALPQPALPSKDRHDEGPADADVLAREI